MPRPTITAKRYTKNYNRRRNILCVQIIECPFVSPVQCLVRSDTSSSMCKFITPLVLKPNADIETGIRGVCNIDYMQNMFCLPLGMLFYTLRTLALRLALWDARCNIARYILCIIVPTCGSIYIYIYREREMHTYIYIYIYIYICSYACQFTDRPASVAPQGYRPRPPRPRRPRPRPALPRRAASRPSGGANVQIRIAIMIIATR